MKRTIQLTMMFLTFYSFAFANESIDFHVKCDEPGPDCVEMSAVNSAEKHWVQKAPAMSITKENVESIYISEKSELNPETINLEFNESASLQFEQLTKKHIGQFLAVVVNNTVMLAPRVNEPISGGRLQITSPNAEGGYKALYDDVPWLKEREQESLLEEKKESQQNVLVYLVISVILIGGIFLYVFKKEKAA